ncbi:MAG: methylmalonyl-CoA mutase family protein [Candidatus Zixiibacteriota bacterium]
MSDKPDPKSSRHAHVSVPPLSQNWPDGFDPSRDLGLPGRFPFTRGVYEKMYTERLWTMRQYAGFGTAKESNERYRYLLSQGQTGLSVAFDLPTQMGYDSDHPLARGEVGRTGVAIDGIWDMEVLLEEIPLDQVSISMTINATAAILLALVVAVAENRGIDLSRLSGTIQNDILKEYVARGTFIYPPKPSMRLVADTFRYCKDELPKWNPISISGYHIREAGATAVQEVAFTLSHGVAYVENAIAAGLNIDEFAPRLSFFLSSDNDFLEEIAKFRCARRMWAKLMKERFGARNPASMRFRFHAQTAGSTLTAQQPLVNVPRVTLQALAAVLGGVQSLHTNAYDEALALPTEESAELALRTQQVIGYESGVAGAIDPLGGSFHIETLTTELEKQATALMDEVERIGGAVSAIENGFIAGEIERSAWEMQKRVERQEQIVVGVNKFVKEDDVSPPKIARLDPQLESSQRERLATEKANRDEVIVQAALDELKRRAQTDDEPLMPQIVACVQQRCTLGEISDALRQQWGEFHKRD